MPETPRRRAPGMTPGQRRKMIVAAALPLVAEYGAAVTTGRIARAAGIGEATIFRVFADKDELLDACVAEAVGPEHVVRELASIDLQLPPHERLTQAAEAMHAHLERMGTVIGALHASGRHPGRPSTEQPDPEAHEIAGPDAREAANRALRDAVAELLAPERDALRLPPEKVAAVFLGTLFAQLRGNALGEFGPTAAELADVILHGVLDPTDRSRSDDDT
ncbi:TetR/AcrR family transcriptional regulator [Streptomyces sp. TRM72054]|uniref:TetR/AcrR family transcriptional regulator n=1 Tax=Streptomyces sp. TRM72054 TaxID=2870562 RepID=UPI0021AB4738|nr:TetR/AcrR family transcriptional regulator [Streptomyces sp. TRM72054]